MVIAAGQVHWGKPMWVTERGAELPVTHLAIGLTLALAGPGRLPLERALGMRVPAALGALTAAAVAGGSAVALTSQAGPASESPQAEAAGAELQGGAGASSTPSPLQNP